MPPTAMPKQQSLERGLDEALRRHFVEAGWSLTDATPPVDFAVERGKAKFVVELKAVRQARMNALEGAFAAAHLRAAKHAGRRAKAAVAIGAPSLSTKARAQLRAFAKTYAPKTALIFIDARGLVEAYGIDLPSHRPSTGNGVASTYLRSQPVNLFSDLNRWLLKLLLGPHLPLGQGPQIVETIESSSDLATRGGVSTNTAHRLTRKLRDDGFLDRRGGLELLRVPELLAKWQRDSMTTTVVDLPVRFVLAKSIRRRLAAVEKKTNQRACLALFSAARSMGYRFVSTDLVHLYVERIDADLLSALGAVAAEQGRIDAQLRVAAHPESIFRGAVDQDDGLATDIIQTWLDLSSHPVRGAKQAERIWRKVFEPAFGPPATP